MRGKLPSPDEAPEERIRVLKEKTLTPASPIDIFESDEQAIFELGSPGYRIACNRSGLGYIETQAELARCEGVMIRRLFTGKIPANTEPTVVFAMIFLGLYGAAFPLGLALGLTVAGGPVPIAALAAFFGGSEMLVGVFALISAIASLTTLIHKKPRKQTLS